MVEFVALASPRSDGRCAALDEVAGRTTAAMADTGEPASAESRTRSLADFSVTRSPLRQHHLAGNDRRKTRARIHISTSWKTKEIQIIGLIPFSSSLFFLFSSFGETYVPGNGTATEFGIVTPQVGGSWHYSWEKGNAGCKW